MRNENTNEITRLHHPIIPTSRANDLAQADKKQNRTLMSDFTAEKSENWRYPQFSVKPSHIGEGLVRVDVSFASFLCAREKEEDSLFLYKEKIMYYA